MTNVVFSRGACWLMLAIPCGHVVCSLADVVYRLGNFLGYNKNKCVLSSIFLTRSIFKKKNYVRQFFFLQSSKKSVKISLGDG